LNTEAVDRVYWILGPEKGSRGGGSGEGVCPGLGASWGVAKKVQQSINPAAGLLSLLGVLHLTNVHLSSPGGFSLEFCQVPLAR